VKKVKRYARLSEKEVTVLLVVICLVVVVDIRNGTIKGICSILYRGGTLQNRKKYFLDGDWDIMIAHPPCTYLSVSGAKWYYHPDDSNLPIAERRPHPLYPNRAVDREEAVQFFMSVASVGIKKIAIENPVGIMSTRWRKPDQIIEPWQFGDEASKKTCLWLKNLPQLIPTKIVGKGEFVISKNGNKSPKWYTDIFFSGVSAEERRTLRSKTFPGIAKAMAVQWAA
jgi:hypothetical protein